MATCFGVGGQLRARCFGVGGQLRCGRERDKMGYRKLGLIDNKGE